MAKERHTVAFVVGAALGGAIGADIRSHERAAPWRANTR